jgi:sialate O-acetylesterase
VSKGASKPQADGSGKWTVCAPDTVGTFSATLYFFGRELQRELKVPVGLINSSVGGTPIESWIAADVQSPKWKTPASPKPKAPAPQRKAAPGPAANRPAATERKNDIGGLFNGKIAPLIPFALRGVLWYQGEANTHPGKSAFYQEQLPVLITDWRKRWNEELPFAWVQLPNYNRPGDGWSVVREAMLKTLRLPNTGMAITVDIGEATNIHPKNKQEVGRRLSLWALGTVYQKKVPATSGPLPAGHEIKNNQITISFKHTDGGLVAKDGELTGFLIAGRDKQWKPAQATINGDKVIVSNPEVANPVAVRYAWASVAVCNLFNGVGLPASPFRTDVWP